MVTLEFSLSGPKKDNQDTIYTARSENREIIALVADGVGGSQGGRSASQCVKRAAEDELKSNNFDPENVIKRAHQYVNSLEIPSAATTATVVYCSVSRLRFAHTGDSRVYIVRGDGLKTLTEDQTEVTLLLKEGILTAATAKTYRRRNVLTHSVEKGSPLSIQKGEFDLQPGDRILLLSDGVYKALNKREICELSLANAQIEDFLSSIKIAIEGRLEDDASVVVIDI